MIPVSYTGKFKFNYGGIRKASIVVNYKYIDEFISRNNTEKRMKKYFRDSFERYCYVDIKNVRVVSMRSIATDVECDVTIQVNDYKPPYEEIPNQRITFYGVELTIPYSKVHLSKIEKTVDLEWIVSYYIRSYYCKASISNLTIEEEEHEC